MEDLKYLIRVDCITFNQASYIEAAMNGFCMQDTNFPFVCTIIDDASTDGEPEVIRRYLAEHFAINDEKTARKEETDDYVMQFAQHKTNKNCFFAVLFLKYNHYSIKKSKLPYLKDWGDTKYVAICEGDDYWIDPLKLQKQFDFMEAHPECSLCFHADYQLLPSGEKKVHRLKIIKEFYTTEDIILGGGGFMATNSMFYRQDLFPKGNRPDFWKNSPIGDLPMMLYFATKGEVGYINELMSTYRVSSAGSWSSRQSTIRIRTAHHKRILKMFDEFDSYTNGTYHKTVISKKNINKRAHIKDIIHTLLKAIVYKGK